jgi:uncharacterized iron-regulated membrane protein/Fe2+ transport system protein FeoA
VGTLRVLHRWLGLLLAAIILAVAASGGVLLLREPYYRARYPALRAPITATQVAGRADVVNAIESRWRSEGVRLIKFPRAGMNAFHVWLGDGSEAFVNAQDGTVIDRWHWYNRLPAFLFELHAHLLGERAGSVVNGIAALFVVFMAMTGAILWWPARRGAFRLRAAVPRRMTSGEMLRSHAAIGVLTALPIVVFAATGAVIVFYEPVSHVMSGLLDSVPAEQPDAIVTPRDQSIQSWNTILETVDATFADGATVFYYPGTANNARLMFRKRVPGEWHPNGRTYVLIDPYTASVVQAIDARVQGAGTRLMHAMYPVHAATVGGPVMVAVAAIAAAALSWLAIGGAWSYLARRARVRASTASTAIPRAIPAAGAAAAGASVRLSEVPVGFTAQLHQTHVDAESRSVLRALGLTDASVLRVCKQGEPCVVQVRATRIGISGRIARDVFVVPMDRPVSKDAPCR